MVEIEKAAFAATWRDESTGEIVGYSLGDTMCRAPRRPWAMTGTDDQWQFPLPCGKCEGCLERLRRQLADRLARKYAEATTAGSASTSNAPTGSASASATCSAQLWLIRIWAPAGLHYYFSRKLHRRRGLELESGTYRLGMNSFAILSRSKYSLPPLLRRLGLRFKVEPIRLSRGRRAWRRLTSGILVARAVYGEQTKRWYARGLPPAERLRWDVVKRAMSKPWRRRTSPRVRSGGRLILVPPAIWSMDGDRLKEYRNVTAGSATPEEVIANQRRLAEIVAGAAATLRLTAPAQPALTREQVRAFYVSMARRKASSRASATSAADSNPSTLGGGLHSSVHSGVADEAARGALDLETWLHSGAPPPEIGREREYEDWLDETWTDGRTRRVIIEARMLEERAKHVDQGKEKFERETASWLERMKSKIRRG